MLMRVREDPDTSGGTPSGGALAPVNRPLQPHYSWDTASLQKKEQFAFVNNEFSSFGNILPADGKAPELGFRNRGKAYVLGNTPFIRFQSEAFRLRPRSRIHATVLDCTAWILSVPLQGTARYVSNGTFLRQNPGHVLISEPSKSIYGRIMDCDFLVLLLDEKEMTGLGSVLTNGDSCANGKMIHPLLGHYFTALASTIETIESREAQSIAEATIAIIRACVSKRPLDIAAAEAPLKTARLEAAQKYINANLKSPGLSSDAVLEFLNVSRRRLHDIFEQTGGVQKYIREQRLKAAYREIIFSSGKRSVLSVAEEYCFSSGANFSRAFKYQFGMTPSDLCDQAGRTGVSCFERWLLELRHQGS